MPMSKKNRIANKRGNQLRKKAIQHAAKHGDKVSRHWFATAGVPQDGTFTH